MKNLIYPRTTVLAIMLLFAGLWRLLVSGGHIPLENFTPIGAMALFGGCYFADKWKAFLFPMFTLLISDFLIMQIYYPGHSNGLLYAGWYWTYGAFFLMVAIGRFIKKVNVKSVVLSAVSAALMHWLISDFGVWVGGKDITTGLPFTKDIQGLLKCYALAIPYMKNILIGNLVFCGVLFGTFELARMRFSILCKPVNIN